MKVKVDIYLTENEIRDAILAAVIYKIDVGQPFSAGDVALYSLNLKVAHLVIEPSSGCGVLAQVASTDSSASPDAPNPEKAQD